MSTKSDFISNRRFADVVIELKLEWHSTVDTADGGAVTLYNWPRKSNGGRWDRFVIVRSHPDGSFSLSIDVPEFEASDQISSLRAMARAQPTKPAGARR